MAERCEETQLRDRRIGAALAAGGRAADLERPVEPSRSRGGITNINFVVEDAGRKFVVRIGGDIEVHGIVRRNELAASRAAHAAGVAPEVVHAEPGVLVLDFIEGRTFTPEDVRNPQNLAAIVDARPAQPPRDPEASARARRALLGVPRRARLRPHACRGAERRPGRARRAARRRRRSWSAPSGRSTSSSATTTCSPPTSSTTASGSGWSTGNMPASTRRSSISAASPPTASCRRRLREALLEAYFDRPVDRRAALPLRGDDRRLAAARDDVEHGVGDPFARSTSTIAAYTAENLARFETGLRRLQGR